MRAFKAAIEARDFEAVPALLSDDVVFSSPVVFAAYRGRDALVFILGCVSRVFQDFEYDRELFSADGHHSALTFHARVGNRDIEGCDFLHTNAEGQIDSVTVMVRPLTAATALAEAMRSEVEATQDSFGMSV